MAWLKAIYEPTTFFSLRPSWTTSTGGKTLLLPTPYALKMALLDVALRTSGLHTAESAWPWIRQLQIGIQLPQQLVVTNLFTKVLKTRRNPAAPGSSDAGPLQKSIGYREYVYHPHPIQLLFEASDANAEPLSQWLMQVNYLGKRGGFVQLLEKPSVVTEADDFVWLTTDLEAFPAFGLVQQLDDCDPKMTFAQANIYDSKKPSRVIRQVVLPYRLVKSSRSYSLYEQVS